ncbi:hypothetical protein B5F85_05710, partial [Olsenella sp. An293]
MINPGVNEEIEGTFGVVEVVSPARLTFNGTGSLRVNFDTMTMAKVMGVRGSDIHFVSGAYDIGGGYYAPAIGDYDGIVTDISFDGADVTMSDLRRAYPGVGSVTGDVSDISVTGGTVNINGGPGIGSVKGDVSNINITSGTVTLTCAYESSTKAYPFLGSTEGNVYGIDISDGTVNFGYMPRSSIWEGAPVIGTANTDATCTGISVSGGRFDIAKSDSDAKYLQLATYGQSRGGEETSITGGRWVLSQYNSRDYGKPDIVEYPSESQQRFLGVPLPDNCVTYFVKSEGSGNVDGVWRIIPKTNIKQYTVSAETLTLTYDGQDVAHTEYDATVKRGEDPVTTGITITKKWKPAGPGDDWIEWNYRNEDPKLPGTYDVLFTIPKSVDPVTEDLYAAAEKQGKLVIEPLKLDDSYTVTIWASKPYDGSPDYKFEGKRITITKQTDDGRYSMTLTGVNGEAVFKSAEVNEKNLKITSLKDVVGVNLPEGGVKATANPGIVASTLTKLEGAQVTPRHYDGTDTIEVEALFFKASGQSDRVRIPVDAGFTLTDVSLADPMNGAIPNYPYKAAELGIYIVSGTIQQWPDDDEGFDFSRVREDTDGVFKVPCLDENGDQMNAVTRHPVTVTSIMGADKVYDGTTTLPTDDVTPVFDDQLDDLKLKNDDYTLTGLNYESPNAGKQAITGTFSWTVPRTAEKVLEKFEEEVSGGNYDGYFAYLNSAAWNYEIVGDEKSPTSTFFSTATGTISKRPITIDDVTVKNKANDGTTTAEVVSVTFDGLVEGESLTLGEDYTATASFLDSDSGENKRVTVTVTLREDGPFSKNYTFEEDSLTANATATASITGPKPGGGGSSGGQTKPSHAIEVEQTAGGSAQVDKDRAPEDSEVTVTATPDAGKQVSSVTVVDEKGNEVEVTPNDNGTWTFEMPGGDVTVRVTFACDGGALCPSEPYPDVDQSQWYHAAVDWAISGGVMTGYGDGTFGPDRFVTRSEAAAVLWNAAGKPALEVDESALPADVPAGEWYTGPVAWSLAEGIFNGNGDGSFAPAGELTREQAA